MRLQDVADSEQSTMSMDQLAGDRALATEVQTRLGQLGLLDPPADGDFGRVSRWALRALCERAGLAFDNALTAPIAAALAEEAAAALFPLDPGGDLAGRIVRAMTQAKYWINRHPSCLNIVYVEGMNPDGTANANQPNQFNDMRLLLRITHDGVPRIEGAWDATTEPGEFYTRVQVLDPDGAARIAFGQYKAWRMGRHNRGTSNEHDALVQVGPITVFRDFNKDFKRNDDKQVTRRDMGIQQHWGYNSPRNDIQKASAGCLVGRSTEGHLTFMALLKTDARFIANANYTFMSAVMPVSALPPA